MGARAAHRPGYRLELWRLVNQPGSCAWCDTSLVDQRRDAKFCSVKCRQASWRFGVEKAVAAADQTPKRLAYADPPYPGLAHYYPERAEVDHAALVSRLDRYDGWALSTSARALSAVLRLCPADIRVAAWLKKPRGRSAWEPLIVKPSRRDPGATDALFYRGRFRAFPGAIVGMKPPQFAVWMFRLLGAHPGDEFIDLFPGSGAVSLAWQRFAGVTSASRPPAGDTSAEYLTDACRAAGGDASLGSSLRLRSTD